VERHRDERAVAEAGGSREVAGVNFKLNVKWRAESTTRLRISTLISKQILTSTLQSMMYYDKDPFYLR